MPLTGLKRVSQISLHLVIALPVLLVGQSWDHIFEVGEHPSILELHMHCLGKIPNGTWPEVPLQFPEAVDEDEGYMMLACCHHSRMIVIGP